MFPNRRVVVLATAVSFALGAFTSVSFSQKSAAVIEPNGAARRANSEGTYVALQSSAPMGDGVEVKDFSLEREGGVFHFTKGSFFLYGPVSGKVTGAVFFGTGRFHLAPKPVSEQRSLKLLTGSEEMEQDFTTLVLRFTDGTADEIRKASTGTSPASKQAASTAQDAASDFRRKLHENFELRLLADVLPDKPGAFFLASFHMGNMLTGRNVLFIVDPDGAPGSAPDEVELSTWDSSDYQPWVAYRMGGNPEDRGVPVHVTAEKLDVRFERSGSMKVAAETSMTVRRDGLRVVALNLYPTLRVSGVYSESGEPLDFVQEDKDNDPQFAVVLAKPAKVGDTVRILTKYEGKDAVRRDGDQMYYLNEGARETWYPAGRESLGAFADFTITFHLPKRLQIVATGKEISHDTDPDGGVRVVWQTQSPIAVAGFNLGDFKSSDVKTPQGFVVKAYANNELPDSLKPFVDQLDLGTMTTTSALPNEVAQGSAAIQVYSDFFGKLPYDHVALTEQSACNFGQSWPMLVYLPICAFWDNTIQQRLGLLDFGAASYWKEVTPHEVAHQWWGQEVGFTSYRDQWMSEGFANFSVSLYLAATNKNLNEFHDFWNEQLKNLVQKNRFGKRPIDVGPLTMGGRVANEKTGNIYQDLIYSKGAYVMHMLQVMYWTPQQGDVPFKNSMQQFVKQYAGKSASTEDLKASFESTMPKWVDVLHNGKLDWFFNEYVYGTELPHYEISSDFTTDGGGETSVHFKVTQSNVSKDFIMLVPLYLQFGDGHTVRVLNLAMQGDTVAEHTVKLGKLPAPAKKMLLNYNQDVLSN